jgi:hypothetical protein
LSDTSESQQARAESVERQLSDTKPVEGDRTTSPGDTQPAAESGGPVPTGGEGPAHHPGTRRGEDIQGDDAKEAGREQTGTQGPTDRPVGTSSQRDSTGVDPQDGPDA